MNRRTWLGFSTAAILVVGISIGSTLLRPGIVFGQVAKEMKEIKSFTCEMVPTTGGNPTEAEHQILIKMTWSAPGSLRVELNHDGKLVQTTILPHNKDGIMLDHFNSTYQSPGKRGEQEPDFIGLVNALANYPSSDQKPAGSDKIDDVKAARFDLSLGGAWKYRVWVHPKTKRPLRVDLSTSPGADLSDRDAKGMRLTKFDWDVKTDGLFDVTPPREFKVLAGSVSKVENAAPVIDDEKIIKLATAAFRACKEGLRGYPKTDSIDALEVVADIEKRTGNKINPEALDGLFSLQRMKHFKLDAKYNGKSVGPDGKDKVLFRWKQKDGKYRVIYGDLRDEAVSGDRLKTLEGK